MKKEEILRILVVFIITGILLMPVSSAVFLGSVSVSGSDGIPNVRRGLDYTTVSVQVSDVGNGSLLSQLTFDTPHGFHQPPDSCDGGTCYFTSDTGFLVSNVYTATANYPGVSSVSASFVADGDAPTTVELTVGQEKDKVKANYYMHDPEYGGTNTMTCSGITKLEFYVDGDLDSTVDVGAGEGNGTKVCEYEGEAELTVNTNGDHEVFIKSYDALDNVKSSIIRPFETDFTPAVISNTFSLFKDGVEMNYIRTAGGTINDIEVRFEIKEESDLVLLKADLSEVGGGVDDAIYPYASGNSNNKCLFTSVNSTWNCRFYVNLELSSNNPSIHVSLEDKYGIEVSQSLTGDFITDNDNASLKFLGTDICYENVCYVNSDEVQFIAELYDKGSGFRNELIDGGRNFIFNLEDFGLGQVNAENCTQSGSDWDCYYDTDLSGIGLVNGNEKEIYMYSASKDDAGNPITESDTVNRTVIVDTLAPEKYGAVVVQESLGGRTDWLQEGDNLDFIINFVEDESVILAENAFADFSQIVGDDEPDLYTNVTAEECGEGVLTEIIVDTETNETEEHILYECRWNVENVAPTGSAEFDKVTFSVSDIAGNSVDEEYYVWILTISTEENPNYFEYGVMAISPPAVDRRATDLVDYSVFVQLGIEEYLPTSSGMQAIPLKVDKNTVICVGEYFAGEPTVFGNTMVPGNFTVMLDIAKGDYNNVSEVEFNCSFEVISQYENFISNPENESVVVVIDLFDSVYDPLGDAFLKKIKSNTVILNKFSDWIVKLDDFITNLKRWCGISATFAKLDQTISAIDTTLLSAALAVYVVPGLQGVAKGIWEPYHNTVVCNFKKIQQKLTLSATGLNGTVPFIGKTCAFVQCDKCWGWGSDTIGGAVDKINDFMDDNAVNEVITAWNEDILGAGGNRSLKSTGFPSMGKFGFPGQDDSIIMALTCGCVPAIVHFLAKYTQIECTYVSCMFEMAAQGAPFEHCQRDKKVGTCKFIIGPFLDAMPNPFAYLGQIMDWVKDLIETAPVRALSMGMGYACQKYNEAYKKVNVPCESSLENIVKNGWLVACGASEALMKWDQNQATWDWLANPGDWKLGDFFQSEAASWQESDNCLDNPAVKDIIERMGEIED